MKKEMSEIENDKSASDRAEDRAQRVVKYNEKFNVPEQTEKEEAETHEDAQVEHLADEREIQRRKKST
jgi:hypothetical protein